MGMDIINKLSAEIIECYKNGDSQKRVFLQTLKAAIMKEEKDKGKLTEDSLRAVLKREKKIREEALEQYQKANRDDLVQQNQKEISYINQLLPAQISNEEIEKIARGVISGLEEKNFGNAMKATLSELKGKADGKTVSEIVKKILS